MDLSRPYSAVSPSLDGDVLAVLAGTTRPLTGREVTKLARRGSQRGVQAVLERLVAHGLAEQQAAGRALLYTLNRDHLAAGAVQALAGLRGELIHRVADAIGCWSTAPLHASIFGSFARGEGDTDSDVDLFVVRADVTAGDDEGWRKQLDGLAERVHRWSGNHAGVVEVSSDDMARLRDERPAVVDSLRSEAIVVYGLSVEALFGAA